MLTRRSTKFKLNIKDVDSIDPKLLVKKDTHKKLKIKDLDAIDKKVSV